MDIPTTVVMYPGLTWYGNGQHFPTAEGLLDVSRWAEIVATYGDYWRDRDGVVVVNAGAELTDTKRNIEVRVFIDKLAKLGYKAHPMGASTGWFTCRGSGGAVAFGVLPWIDQSRTPLFELNMPANVIAQRLAAYEGLTGGVWLGTGGLSGTGLLHQMWAGKHSPRWRYDKAPTDIVGRSFELLGTHHHRQSTDADGTFVHMYDTRAMYLAGAACAELAWDGLEQCGPQEFDPTRPGYWRVTLSGLQAAVSRGPGLPSTQQAQTRALQRLVRSQNTGDLVWVSTPIMQYLTEQLGPVEVHDSVTAARRSRIMRGWADRLRDARLVAEAAESYDGAALVRAVKDTYSRTIGMLKRNGGRIYRPDWRDTVMDTAKVNMLRKIDKAGVHPLRYNVDAVWIASDSDEPANLFGDTGHIGGLRHVEVTTMDAYRARYEPAAAR